VGENVNGADQTDNFAPAAADSASAFDAKAVLAVMSQRPGVYRMIDAMGEVLYVGKARNLKKRVSNYFRANGLDTKTMALVSHIKGIEITITNSETEALLLEQNLIKKYRPPYNIQLRDDKTYPYIMLTHKDAYPRLSFYRGSRRRDATFFGPYPSASAVRESLALLQKVFRVRQCEDSYFRNRSRPCLQHQIGRCTAPCVGLISPADYAQDVQDASLFLQGRSDALIQTLVSRMEKTSAALEFEQAARFRDRIADLRRIQSEQVISGDGSDADVIAAELQGAYTCVHIITIRGGRIIGSRNLFPKDRLADTAGELLESFIAHYYLRDSAAAMVGLIPAEIIVHPALSADSALQEALSSAAGRQVRLPGSVRGHRARWLALAVANVQQAMLSHINNKQTMFQRFERLQTALDLDFIPQRIECFDISHTMGESTVASCVVFDHNGPLKSDYRRYNINGIQPGDDYAAMDQALSRRFRNAELRLAEKGTEVLKKGTEVLKKGTEVLKKGTEEFFPRKNSSVPFFNTSVPFSSSSLPDILLIDGGKGQLAQAVAVLGRSLSAEQLHSITLLGIAKGISRRAGQETLFLAIGESFQEIAIDTHSPALHLLQQVRDEAHRFAITGHRQQRSKTRNKSTLEEIPGLGPTRRRELLRHFGGQQEIMRASEADLARTPGISKKLAAVIYEALHNE
jgi:excinuclease ABC subunit C